MQWLLLALTGGSVVAVGILYYQGRKQGASATDARVARVASEQTSGFEGLWKRCEVIDEKISSLEKWTATEVATNSTVNELAQKLAGSISWQERMRIPERFSESHDAVDGLRKKAAKADKAIELIPSYFQRQDELSDLKNLLGGIILDFQFIREVYPSIAAARLPFSDWRKSVASDAISNPGLLLAESAAKRLERYVEIAQERAVRWGRDVFNGDLFTLVPRWKYVSVTDVSGEGFMTILQKHFSELRKVESDYAVLWCKTVEDSATIS